ncbi:MAG: hypothetical protein OXH96_07765 [Spirochaetaceae bacterium]|nr:hypothetical protein [Spirochaetaceae bacterium]
MLDHTLQIGLAHLDTPEPRARFRVKAHALGIKPGNRGVSMNQLSAHHTDSVGQLCVTGRDFVL